MSIDASQPNRPRHCMIVHAYYPIGETRVEREARALVDRGYAVDVICLKRSVDPKVEEQDGITIYRMPVRRDRTGGAVRQLGEYLVFFALAFVQVTTLHRRQPYGVVQVHNLPDFLVLAALMPKLTGARVVLDLHDLMPEFYAARFNREMTSWPVRLVRWQEQLSCSFADQVITVTKLWRETLIQRGVPPDKVSVVMNVADNRIFYRTPPPSVPTPDEHFRLIYHGNITDRYGVDLVIRAVDLVRAQIPQIHLTIHGKGSHLETLQKLVKELRLEAQVEFSLRALLTSELPELIRRADVGLVPYRSDVFTDGILPTKLMEYTALGVPVIAARTPGIAAYFDDTMVQFFEPGNVQDLQRCILALYSDRSRRVQLAHNADKFNQDYSWSSISAEYAQLVGRLAQRGTG
jgi:glycosyltransferase involved in cell wall biosynthesis